MLEKIFLAVAAVLGVVLVLGALLMLPTYFLWNWLMPELFGLKEITLWQALGLLLLSGFLFRSSASKS